MPDEKQSQFLRDLDRKLWPVADRLRSDLDTAVYKHALLGLIYLDCDANQFDESHRLKEAIRDNLASIGFTLPEVG